ncbi:MAG TPA: hypothetical protein DCS29_02785 [Candidatus Magasanikbacteria bacterium]|nr:MAG: hypothetical protein A2479_03865 [Candidatus Magasanikbacteria bacterium RIFOXYC2_FULL_39_8]HAT03678.1 hypothetical protein [Candidatus Magasanikbacteria bacterium]
MNKMILIIPIFNGEKYIHDTCKELESFFLASDCIESVIFVNDGSIDGTREVLESIKQTYSFPHTVFSYEKNRGKGYAVAHAVAQINGDYVGFTDIELPYGLQHISEGLSKLASYDMVVGSREIGAQRSGYRRCMSKIFRLFLPRGVRKINDTQCGLKFFRIDVARVLFSHIKTYRWVFDIELFLLAEKKKYHVCTLPVVIKEECITPKGGVSLLRDGVRILSDLLRVRMYY